MRAERQEFYGPREILGAVESKVEQAKETGEAIDYLAFVPDGEPTLDINLGREIELLRPLGVKIAVITNSSLAWREDVREDLGRADWVSLKVDSTQDGVWRTIDRPHGALRLASILEGMLEFAKTYAGELVTETMLVRGVNDGADHVREVADFLSRMGPAKAYLSIATRPPAEQWVQAPDEDAINLAYQILSERLANVEHLIGYEGNAFASTGDVEEDLLSITAVHPMREEAVAELLTRTGADWEAVRELVDTGQLLEAEYEGRKFFVRRFR
jgi:wyosine [tRNA(Phe)-imidazoG37] synthetase (radical SAM superfamily)